MGHLQETKGLRIGLEDAFDSVELSGRRDGMGRIYYGLVINNGVTHYDFLPSLFSISFLESSGRLS